MSIFSSMMFYLDYRRGAWAEGELEGHSIHGAGIAPEHLPKFEKVIVIVEWANEVIQAYCIGCPNAVYLDNVVLLAQRRERAGRNWPAMLKGMIREFKADTVVTESAALELALTLLGIRTEKSDNKEEYPSKGGHGPGY